MPITKNENSPRLPWLKKTRHYMDEWTNVSLMPPYTNVYKDSSAMTQLLFLQCIKFKFFSQCPKLSFCKSPFVCPYFKFVNVTHRIFNSLLSFYLRGTLFLNTKFSMHLHTHKISKLSLVDGTSDIWQNLICFTIILPNPFQY